MKILSLTWLGLLTLLSVNSSKPPKVCLISQNGKLLEKRYLNAANKTIRVITFDTIKKQPVDSVSIQYGKNQYIRSLTVYVYDKGKYNVDPLPFNKAYYTNIYSEHNQLCSKLIQVKNETLIENEISNICYVTGALLPNGSKVASHKKQFLDDGVTVVEFNNLNARFKNLSEVIQSYFYNRILDKLSLYIKNGYLMQEDYFFSTGEFMRRYSYKDGYLDRLVVICKYKNGSRMGFTRNYDVIIPNE